MATFKKYPGCFRSVPAYDNNVKIAHRTHSPPLMAQTIRSAICFPHFGEPKCSPHLDAHGKHNRSQKSWSSCLLLGDQQISTLKGITCEAIPPHRSENDADQQRTPTLCQADCIGGAQERGHRLDLSFGDLQDARIRCDFLEVLF
jgi:hypothetical protein